MYYYLFTILNKFVFAADPDISPLTDTLSKYYKSFFVPIGAVLAAVVIIYGGVLYSTSQGDAGKITVAKEYIFGAIIGLVILVSAGYIVGLVIPF
jgi:hypothetical protein